MMLLVGGALLVAALVLVALVPLADCPECEGGRIAVVTSIETKGGDEIAGCTTCDDRKKVSLLKKWSYRGD